MTKELVTIEFRYQDSDGFDTQYISKKITIGVFDTFEQAIEAGNKALEAMEQRFKIHVFPDGRQAQKERFSKNGGPFGTSKRLITDLAYLRTPFSFFAKITKLGYNDLDQTITDAVTAMDRYRNFKEAND